MTRLRLQTWCGVMLLGLLSVPPALAREGVEDSTKTPEEVLSAQTFTKLYDFDGTHGAVPVGGLIQATDGNLYGVTFNGGANNEAYCNTNPVNGCGTIFKITPSGTLTTLYTFGCSQINCPDGLGPNGLVQATDGNFYGTTAGTYVLPNYGTVFKMTPSGQLTTLYNFCSQSSCADGAFPGAGLIQATDGNFYGTTSGANTPFYGTVFRITPSGTLTTLYMFGPRDGGYPDAMLEQAANGKLYGTTGSGTIFEITIGGTYTKLDSFAGDIDAALIQAPNGYLYGLTGSGGTNGGGSVFRMTTSGELTTLYSFCSQSGCPDGAEPEAPLLQATDGNFYGTTAAGGAYMEPTCFEAGCGTLFKITPSGKLTTLYSFCSQSGCPDGSDPSFGAGLTQDTNGNFYGTTYWGGDNASCSNGCGTVFRLSVGLGPFVAPQPSSGKVGATIKILGTNLTGATSVTFNGIAATFKVVSKSQIATTVPAGATSGKVTVKTPSGTLTSNVNFRVR